MKTVLAPPGERGNVALRSALALSLASGTPFQIENFRPEGRSPGFGALDVACIGAAKVVSAAHVSGGEAGGKALRFAPGEVKAGEYALAAPPSADAARLLEVVLPALSRLSAASRLTLKGATHGRGVRPFEFMAESWCASLSALGSTLTPTLEAAGFAPEGVGSVNVQVSPAAAMTRPEWLKRGDVTVEVEVLLSRMPAHLSGRALAVLERRLHLPAGAGKTRFLRGADTSGMIPLVRIQSETGTVIFSQSGRKKQPPEEVANRVAEQALDFLGADVPVGMHQAECLLIPLALAGGGALRTVFPSDSLRETIRLIEQFLPVRVRLKRDGSEAWRVRIGKPS